MILSKYDELQDAQLNLARLQGLNDKQLSIMDNMDLDYLQMEQIRLGFTNNLSVDYVSIYANPLFSAPKMLLLRLLCEAKFDILLISVAARPELSYEQTYEAYAAITAGLQLDQTSQIITNKITHRQIAAARLEYEISRLAEKSIVVNLKTKAKKAIEKNESVKKAEKIKLDGFSDSQLSVINLFNASSPSKEQLEVICKKELNPKQMQEIRWGFEINHLTIPQVMSYASDPSREAGQMAIIREGQRLGFGHDQIELIADRKLNHNQMKQVLQCFDGNHPLSVEQVSLLANPEIPAYKMQEYRMGFTAGMTAEELGLLKKEI
jgi:hypothetical protein